MLKILYSALEALGSAVPIGLGAITWIGYRIGPEMIAPLVLAMFAAFAVTNLAATWSNRPMVYSVRFFEISLLVGYIDSFTPKLAGWGLVDTAQTRLTLVLMACVGAALLLPVFYVVQLHRITRYIPAPVFSGFLNAIALILIIGQVKEVGRLVNDQPTLLVPALLIAASCLCLAYVVKRWHPRLPAGALGIAAASTTALVLEWMGRGVPMIFTDGTPLLLPWAYVSWSILDAPGVALVAVLQDVGFTSVLLASVVFLNTVIAGEVISQVDDKPTATLLQSLAACAGQITAAALGSMPMSGSPVSTMAAMRTGGFVPATLPLAGLLILAFYAMGVLAWVPLAAVIGLLLFEAYCLADRASVCDLWHYISQPNTRAAMNAMRKEDLLLIVLVTLAGVLLNMVAALVVGMVLGTILFVRRNGKSPIKDVHSGQLWRSNCVRSPADRLVLDRQGTSVQCVRLQGALYFGMARALRTRLEALLQCTRWMVLDWHGVASFDSTLQGMFDRFEQAAAKLGVQVVHCARADGVGHSDVDRALEFCENQLLAQERHTLGRDVSLLNDALQGSGFFAGLDASDQAKVFACFERRSFAAGECLMRMGDTSRDLHLIESGHADVMLQNSGIRLAGMGAGSVAGEMGFLTSTPRAADVYATQPLVSQVLTRERFDQLSQAQPQIAQQLMQNLCTELASRLRALHGLVSRGR
jgi:sulfate permease, SulP family